MRRSSVRLFLLVLCAVITGAYLAREPWIVYQEQRAKERQAKAELRQAEEERASLARQKAEVESSIGREKLARERGFVKKGEVRLGPDGP